MRRTAVLLALCILLGSAGAAASADPQAWSDAEYLTPGVFSIDGAYRQEGMNAPYESGYAPAVADDALQVVLPLLADRSIDGDIIYCGLDLGARDDSPFTYQNYQSIPVRPKYPDADSEQYDPLLYVPAFSLPLQPDRQNGVYPLGVTIRYRAGGREWEQLFTIDFTIADQQAAPSESPGKEPDHSDPGSSGGISDGGSSDPGFGGDVISEPAGGGGSSGGEENLSEPKVILESAVADPNPAQAGEPFTVVCTLRNTSRKQRVSNMTVTYKSQTTDLIPIGGASTQYIESIAANSTLQFAFQMESRLDAQSGPQKIDLSLSYEGSSGTAYTASDEITVQIRQEVRLEHDEVQFPPSVYIGDSITTSLNLFNKGKGTLYNVTVSLDVPGIAPEASAFIGNMESGTSKTADIYANVTGLETDVEEVYVFPEGNNGVPEKEPAEEEEITAGDFSETVMADAGGTGETSGEILITYEDEFGAVSEQRLPVSTDILRMDFIDEPIEEPEEPEQPDGFPWWGWALIGGGAAGAAVPIVRARRKKRAQELEEDAADDELY